jgi:hypothetical protein
MPRIGVLLLTGFSVFLVGCGRREDVSLTEWYRNSDSTGTVPQQPLIDAGNAVEQLARSKAPLDKEGNPSNPITTRTQFFPKQKAQSRELVKSHASAVQQFCQKKIDWNYQPSSLGTPPMYLRGLRLIGQTYLWDIEDGIKNENLELAISGCVKAHRLGVVLFNGGGFEATLGASLINQSRVMIVPGLSRFSAIQLGKLAQGIQVSWNLRPSLARPIENETQSMLRSLQQAQDLAEQGKFKELQEKLGDATRETVDSLEGLKGKKSALKSVFDWIGIDIKDRSEWTRKRIQDPKKAGRPPELKERKTWRYLYRYLASNFDSLTPVLLRTEAKTQIFIIDLYLRQKVKAKRPLPTNLKAFSPAAVRDPFTGESLFYRADRNEFQLYSAGEDGVDNGGETDSLFQNPDLTLEQSGMIAP